MKKFTFREMGAYKLDRLWWSTVVSDAWLGTTVTGRPVVAHVRRDPWAAASGFVARYAPLARGWNGLRQPGVVPLVEVGQAGGVCWVVEEFVEGETLRALLVAATAAKVKLAPVEATAMVLQLCRGLVALDRLIPPLVHGDVSAASVMVGADGEVRLSSVGVAAAHDADATLGPARAELGGIAPEELTASAGSATDVFRLGLVWLELLTGRAVFTGATHAEVQARVQKYPGLSAKHFPGFPPAVAQVLSSMLAKAPAERPAVADLEPRLAEVFHSLGGAGDGTAPVARAFGRVFPGRAPLLKTLEGTQPLSLAPLPVATAASSPASLAVGAVSADGAVTLAKMAPKRVTADEMAALRAREAAEAAQASAAAWLGQHEADEGNPKDVQLGAVLIGQQRLSVEHADAALRQSQAFGSTLLYSLNFLGFFDDEEGLPFQAEVLKQPYVTITQLLELDLSKNAALLSPQVAAEWMAVPLKLESGGLTVAIAEPGRLDVLEVLKRSAKVRSVKGVRATERTLEEGLKRVYEGKTTPPDWLQRPRPRAAAPAPSPEALGDLPGLDELGLPPPPGLGEPPPSDLAPPPAELTGPASVTPAPGAPGNSTSGFDLPPAMVAAAPGSSGFDLPPAMVAAAAGSSTSGFDLPPAMVAAAAGNSTSGFDLPPAMVAAAAGSSTSGFDLPPSGFSMMSAPGAPVVASPVPPPSASSPSSQRGARPDAPSMLDVTARLFDAILSLVPERGLEAARLLSLVRAVSRQSGATGVVLDQVRLCAKALLIAALLEGKRAFEVPSLPAVMGVLAAHYRDFEDLLQPAIDADDTVPSDPRAAVLVACFWLCRTLGDVPASLEQAQPALPTLRAVYPAPLVAAIETVLAR